MSDTKRSHAVEIVPVEMHPHGNADSLSIIPIYGYSYVGRTSDWVGVKRAAYIPPDSIVDAARPEFSFLIADAKGLDLKVRIKARRLRGVVSFGLLVPVPDDTPLGGDWAEQLGVEHYEPPLAHEKKARGFTLGGDESPAPETFAPKYDLDNFRRFHDLFVAGEPVVVTEKLDGANARFTYSHGEMYCGSRERWVREFPDYSHVTVEFLTSQGCTPEKAEDVVARLAAYPQQKRNIWWQAFRDNTGIGALCREFPGGVLYGEVFGDVNCIKYGLGGNRFAAFDFLHAGGNFADPEDLRHLLLRFNVPAAPLVASIPYDFDTICGLAEGATLVPGAKQGTIREGVVVSPLKDRRDPHLGRVKLKVVSGTFLERFR